MFATPLIFASLGGVMSERSGTINIGLEGMMTIGAFVASWIALKTSNPWLGLLAGGLAGALLAALHALSCLFFKANQVVSGVAINFLGPGLAIFLSRIIFDGTSMTPPLDLEFKIPVIFHQYATVYLAFLASILIWIFFEKTKWGLRFSSTGENPKAALAAGVKVMRYKILGVLLSGFLAGMGGASLSIAIVSNFRPTLISGQGFIALAAMIFGKWKPMGTTVASLFFGFSGALVVFVGGLDFLHIPSALLALIPYCFTLIVLVFFMGKSTTPSGLGEM